MPFTSNPSLLQYVDVTNGVSKLKAIVHTAINVGSSPYLSIHIRYNTSGFFLLTWSWFSLPTLLATAIVFWSSLLTLLGSTLVMIT